MRLCLSSRLLDSYLSVTCASIQAYAGFKVSHTPPLRALLLGYRVEGFGH